MEDVAAKFVAAWEVFSRTCAATVAPEATYQAWFAHYLISQFGIDRVAREPDFGHHSFTSPLVERFKGHQVMLDAVLTRQPGIIMPRRAHREGRDIGGLPLLGDLAVIAELKISCTQGQGLAHTEVARDFWKLSMLLTEADRHSLPAPRAYVCVLDNHPTRTYNREWLLTRLADDPVDDRVQLLFATNHAAPQTTQ